MLIFITLTQECNLKCTYCGGGELYDIEDVDSLPHPKYITYEYSLIKKLKNFSKTKDPQGLVVCFYGGEPLVKPELIRKTIEYLPQSTTYCLQTNGILLKGFKDYKFMSTILVSVDGDSEITNLCRGEGTFEKAIEGCLYLRSKGYNKELIARMTCHQESNIFDDVKYLLNFRDDITGKYLFDTVHWQLDVLFDSPGLNRWNGNFQSWRDDIYNPGITKLANYFVNQLTKKNRILGIAPFLGVLYTFLINKKVTLRCQSGITSFNITTGGKVTNCPIAPEFDIICRIEDEKFNEKYLTDNGKKIGGYCEKCDILDQCGGRCLYVNKKCFHEEDKKSFDEVCITIKHLIKCVKEIILPTVKNVIKEKKYKLEDFHYPKYNNSVEIIP